MNSIAGENASILQIKNVNPSPVSADPKEIAVGNTANHISAHNNIIAVTANMSHNIILVDPETTTTTGRNKNGHRRIQRPS